MVSVSDQDMNTHLAEISRVSLSVCARMRTCPCIAKSLALLCFLPICLFAQSHTDKLNTQVALHQLYQYASKYYDGVSFTQVLFKASSSF